jgi:hypothetical protein
MREAATAPTCTPASRLLALAVAACERLERLLIRIERQTDDMVWIDLATPRTRLDTLIQRLPQGSDYQAYGDDETGTGPRHRRPCALHA